MQKKPTLTTILFWFLATTTFAQTEWKTFKSTEENFSISLPSQPKQERTSGRTPLGNGHHIYSLDANGVSFVISNSIIEGSAKEPKGIKQTFDFARDLI